MHDLRMRIVTTFYRRATLMACDVRDAVVPIFPIARITTLTPADVQAYVAFRPNATPHMISERIARGDVAYVAWVDERIVHAAWVSVGRATIAYLQREFPLAPDDLFIHDSFTLPEFRQRGIARARMMAVFHEYARRGFLRALAIVADENRSAAMALHAGGYRPIARYSCIRVGQHVLHQRPR